MAKQELYSLKEVHEITSIPLKTLRLWRSNGTLPVVKIKGKLIRVTKEELDKLIKGE